MRFRPLVDPLFLLSVSLYALNRWWLKPHLDWDFLHTHLNDLICIPFWVPLLLLFQKGVGLREHDRAPERSEIIIPLLLWTWIFEAWLPASEVGRQWCVADPVDVLCYATGALVAAAFWRHRYRERGSAFPETVGSQSLSPSDPAESLW